MLLLIAGAGSAIDNPANPIVGSWKLVTWTDTRIDNLMPYYPFGAQPAGQLVFTADGHFSAHVLSDPNGALPPDLPRRDFDDLTGPALEFSGTYTFDPATGALNLNVAPGSTAPAYVMSDTGLTAVFQDNKLVITGNSVRRNGRWYSWKRVLERQ